MKNFGPKSWILPQPVLIIGTYDKEKNANAMNAAWGGQWDVNEIVISMGAHATTENLNRCPDFTVAFATVDTMIASDFVGITSAMQDPQKIDRTGWTIIPSENIDAPIFKDFPMTLECRIKQKIDESDEGYYIIAEIINVIADERFLSDDGLPDIEKMQLISYDPIHKGYIKLGQRIGNAFCDGKRLK